MTGLRFGNGRESPNLSMMIDSVIKPVRKIEARINSVINPSFETYGLNWVTGSGGVNEHISSLPHSGSKCLKVAFPDSGTFKYIGQSLNVEPGFSYIKASIAVRSISGSKVSRLRIGYRDTPTSGAISYGDLTPGVVTNLGWSIVNIESAIPPTSMYLSVLSYMTESPTGSTAITPGTSWAIDSLIVTLGHNQEDTPNPEYFDGDSSDIGDWINGWEGIPHASRSIAIP